MNKHTFNPLTGMVLGLIILTGCGHDPVSTAITAIQQGHLQKAEQLLAQALRDDPANVNALMNLSIVQLKSGLQDQALAGFLQVAEQTPQDARPLEFAASIHLECGRWQEAAPLLAEALRRDPRSPSVQTALALVELNTLGAIAARDQLVKLITERPSYAPALFNLGVINRDWLKNQNEAKKYFQRYLALEKSDSHTVIAKVVLNEKMRKSATLPVLPRNPQVAAEAFSEGVQFHQTRNYDKAIEAYQRALQSDPSLVRAHYNLGLLLRDKRDLAQARIEFEEALASAPEMSDARYMLALVMLDQGLDAEATRHLTTLTQKAPRHAEAHLALGLLYKKDPAKRDLARKELNTYLKLDPNGSSAREIRNWLKYLQ
jgi:tetratricopeptide (TPR) repeat protein